jgi:toxin FitB
MALLDSNIIIYSAKPEFADLRKLISDQNNIVSAFSKLEVLGFHSLLSADKLYFESVFDYLEIHPVDLTVIDKAIALRQVHKLSPGDAIIAATSVNLGVSIITRNTADFRRIPGVDVINPIE